jgi:hypothetical protein
MALSAGQAAVIAAMRAAGVPITRKNYIEFDYGGDVTPDAESEIPDYPWDDEPAASDAEPVTDADNPSEPHDPKGK